MKNIKAIIFDAYGTLFDVNSAAEKCKDKIGDKWEGFANYWRTTQLEYTWLRSLMKRHKDFWQITEDSLDKSMKTYEIDSSMRNELLDLYKILSPFSEVPEVLKKLKEKNLKLAAQFYRLAADQGQDLAQQRLGNCYQNGLGVPKNDTEAYVWFSLSAENGQTLNGRGRAGELLDEITKDLSPKKLVKAKAKVSHLQKKIALKEKANYTKIINQLSKNGWRISMNIDKNGGHSVKAKKEGKTSQSQAPNWRLAFNAVKRQCEEWPEEG